MTGMSKSRVALAGVVVLAATLRFIHLGTDSLWFDESISVAIARLDWPGLWRVISRLEANMSAYYLLLHLWIKLGETEAMVRSLSVIAGVLTVPAIYALGKKLFDNKVALIGSVLLSANAFHIRYSQEARGYALEVLFVTLSSLLFVCALDVRATNERAIDQQSRGLWALYVLASALAVYTHFFGALVLAAQWLSLAWARRRSVPWRQWLIAASAIVVLLLPLAAFVFTRDSGQVAWIPKARLYDIYGLFDALSGGGRLLLLAYCLPCCAVLVLMFRGWMRSQPLPDEWRYSFLLTWLLFPVLVAFAISLRKPIFVDRYLIGCLPPLVLLAAAGLAEIKSRWILAVSLLALLTLSLRRIPWYATPQQKEDWRGATAYVVSRASVNDGILFYISYGRLGFDYYARRLMPVGQAYKVAFPVSLDLAESEKVDPDDALLVALPQKYEQVWLVLRFNDADPSLGERDRAIEAMLKQEYREENETVFRGVRVLEFSGAARTSRP